MSAYKYIEQDMCLCQSRTLQLRALLLQTANHQSYIIKEFFDILYVMRLKRRAKQLLPIERTNDDGDEDEKPPTKSQKNLQWLVIRLHLMKFMQKSYKSKEQRSTGSISYDELLARELQRQFDEEMSSGENMTGPSKPSTSAAMLNQPRERLRILVFLLKNKVA
ncbi:hypothetical protein K501DRAFT_272601 [Backusella circina FSU 941]|nr:hypothetical protein K501DRAFT_272601 [Backusella circina FSU 941]